MKRRDGQTAKKTKRDTDSGKEGMNKKKTEDEKGREIHGKQRNTERSHKQIQAYGDGQINSDSQVSE